MRIATLVWPVLLFAVAPLHADEASQWISLFNGKDLSGWTPIVKGQPTAEDPLNYFSVHDGAIHVYKDTPTDTKVTYGVILSDRDYGHYRLRFEYQWGQKRFAPRAEGPRDAGLLFHCFEKNRERWPGGTWPPSVECQVQEHDSGDLFLVGTMASTAIASLDDKLQSRLFLAKREGGRVITAQGGRVRRGFESDTLKGWNKVEVEVRGDRARHWVNGRLVMDLWDMRRPLTDDGKTWIPLERGRIAFQCEAAEVRYRNIEILEFPHVDPLEPRKSSMRLSVPGARSDRDSFGHDHSRPRHMERAAEYATPDEPVAHLARADIERLLALLGDAPELLHDLTYTQLLWRAYDAIGPLRKLATNAPESTRMNALCLMMQAAVLSAINQENVFSALNMAVSEPAVYQELLKPLCPLAFEFSDCGAIDLVVGLIAQKQGELSDAWRYSTLSRLIAWFESHQRSISADGSLGDTQSAELRRVRLEASEAGTCMLDSFTD